MSWDEIHGFGYFEGGDALEFIQVQAEDGPGTNFCDRGTTLPERSSDTSWPSSHLPQDLHSLSNSLRTFPEGAQDVIQDLQQQSLIVDWRETKSWKLLKELSNSVSQRVIANKTPLSLHCVLGMALNKVKVELEFTQEDLNDVPTPDENSSSSKPNEYLVSHTQVEQEMCDTKCNLNEVSTSTGLGGMHLVLFKAEGNHRLPSTNLSPGDMVCVRICDSRGAGATSCLQGFVNNLGEDGCSISVALESHHRVPTLSCQEYSDRCHTSEIISLNEFATSALS